MNVSLDTLCATRFGAITRGGRIADTLDGIDAAREAGLAVKLNTVVLGGLNDDELDVLVAFAHRQDMDITFIEVMPIGEEGHGRSDRFVPLDQVRAKLGERFTLVPSLHRSGGPARYWQMAETGRRVGFIAATSCNSLRGLQPCPCHRHGPARDLPRPRAGVDLRAPLRSDRNGQALDAAIDASIAAKPAGHAFAEGWTSPATRRGMHVTGG